MIELTDVEFEILPASVKLQYVDYADTRVVKTLLEGEAILVPINTSIYKMYRFAKARGFTLHKRKTPEGLVLWLEPRSTP